MFVLGESSPEKWHEFRWVNYCTQKYGGDWSLDPQGPSEWRWSQKHGTSRLQAAPKGSKVHVNPWWTNLSDFFLMVNTGYQLFLWKFSIAMLSYQRVDLGSSEYRGAKVPPSISLSSWKQAFEKRISIWRTLIISNHLIIISLVIYPSNPTTHPLLTDYLADLSLEVPIWRRDLRYITGVGKCQIKSPPTIGDIISNGQNNQPLHKKRLCKGYMKGYIPKPIWLQQCENAPLCSGKFHGTNGYTWGFPKIEVSLW